MLLGWVSGMPIVMQRSDVGSGVAKMFKSHLPIHSAKIHLHVHVQNQSVWQSC